MTRSVLREQSTTWFADLVKLPQAHVLNGHVEVCGRLSARSGSAEVMVRGEHSETFGYVIR